MADAGYNQASQGTWVEGDTILYRGVAAILCKNATVQVVLEGRTFLVQHLPLGIFRFGEFGDL